MKFVGSNSLTGMTGPNFNKGAVKSGINTYDNLKNIFDLSANYHERTAQTHEKNTGHTTRGGSWQNSRYTNCYPAAAFFGSDYASTDSSNDTTSRVVVYLK